MEQKGRGRGRGRKPEPMRAPSPTIVDKIKQEQAQAKSGTQSPIALEQMADPPDEGCGHKAMRAPSPTTVDRIKQEQAGMPSHITSADAAETTTGKGQRPPLAEDLKKAMDGGLQLFSPPHPNTMIFSMNKLNPAAAHFVPKFVASLDPNLSDFNSRAPSLGNMPNPIFTKHSIPTSTSSPSSSRLNPAIKEFVPSVLLPTDLQRTSPLPVANGDSSLLGNGEYFEEDSGGYLNAKDIMLGYEKAAPTMMDDKSNEPVMKGAAEMLVKVFNFPGSFDEIGKKFQNTLSNWTPSSNTLTNLAEMLVHWGVTVPDLRYASCRISEMISNTNGIGKKFMVQLISRLQVWHAGCYDKQLSTDNDKYRLACYSGFFAEIFSKIRLEDKPVEMLYPYIFKYVETLLGMGEDYFIREACNILKLTGNTLVHVKDYDERLMEAVIKKMNHLAIDRTLSDTSTSLIMQVVELSGSKWSASAAPVKPVYVSSEALSRKGGTGLNTNAMPFVPYDPTGMLLSETFYDPPIIQQPVSCSTEWDDFVGDDQSVEGYNNSPDVVQVDDDYDGLDPDIELEMEAFIDEIEEHLMLQDFDPELQREVKPGGKQ